MTRAADAWRWRRCCAAVRTVAAAGRADRSGGRNGDGLLAGGTGNLSAAVSRVAQNFLAALRAKKFKFAHGAFLLSFPRLKPSYKRAKPMQHQIRHCNLVKMDPPGSPASPSRRLCLVADRCQHRTTPDAPSAGTVSPAPLAGLITFRPLLSISLRSLGRKLPRPAKTAARLKISGFQAAALSLRHRRSAPLRITLETVSERPAFIPLCCMKLSGLTHSWWQSARMQRGLDKKWSSTEPDVQQCGSTVEVALACHPILKTA